MHTRDELGLQMEQILMMGNGLKSDHVPVDVGGDDQRLDLERSRR